MTTQTQGAVLYIDGSARPNPGFIGWGCHGYIYSHNIPKKPTIVEEYTLTKHGYLSSKLVKPEECVEAVEYLDFVGSYLNVASNNEAELMAFFHSLEKMKDKNVSTIRFLSDSKYVISGITEWCRLWERNNWLKQDGSQISNRDLWIKSFNLYKEMKDKGITIEMEWLKGHCGIKGNVEADQLAVIGMNHSTDKNIQIQCKYTEPKSYNKVEVEKNPLLSSKRVFFNSASKYNTPGQYFMADSGSLNDFVIGKRTAESGFSIVRLKEPDLLLETIKQRQYEFTKETNAIMMILLDRVYSKGVYKALTEYGKYCTLLDKRTLNLNFVDEKPITVERNPTNLSMRALETFNFLEELLDDCVGNATSADYRQIESRDITDLFFTLTEKKIKKETVTVCELKSSLTNAVKDLRINLDLEVDGSQKSIPLTIVFGLDILPRNNLKKLEKHNPKIHLITWKESESTLRYAIVIKSDLGYGIWSNFFADKIFLSAISRN
jgi:ribonuclease HI